MGEKMKKQNLVLFYGCFCSLVFALFYYLMFAMIYENTLHIQYLQVGIYEKATSLEKCQAKLKSFNIHTYTIKKDKQVYVICGLEKYEDTKNILEKEKITYIEKKLTLHNNELVALWNQQEYQKVLERVFANEGKGNGDG